MNSGFRNFMAAGMLLVWTSQQPLFAKAPEDLLRTKEDSLKTDSTRIRHRRTTTWKPTTDFDQRFSFIHNQSVNIWGQRGGVLINDEWKTGIGVYYMNDTKMLSRQIAATGGAARHYLTQSLLFGTGYIEPFLLRKKYWELSVPVEFGYGQSAAKIYQSSDDAFVRSTSRVFLPAGAGLSLSLKLPALPHFKPLSWVGINFLAGYRYCLLQNSYKTDYDGAFWSISGAIFLDRVSDDWKLWKRNRKLKNAE
ncbi:MAG TPA: hypothetical protein VNZ86_02135 [Bacteroidia bacterium]|jgi:hypothetical protein|nr:hypothetical protein [Bacteroidia bacterium]